MSDDIEIAPHLLAACDQEMAAADVLLDLFIQLWKQRESERDTDRLRRISMFALFDIAPEINVAGALELLAIAIERLAKR